MAKKNKDGKNSKSENLNENKPSDNHSTKGLNDELKENERPDKLVNEKETENHGKIIRNVFVLFGIAVTVFIAFLVITSLLSSFNYEGVKFNIIKIGVLTFYTTKLQLYSAITGNYIGDYNIYLRNDPRKLEDIPFNGDINFKEFAVINLTESFHCDGDGVIAVANFVQVLEQFGTKVINDKNATCDDLYGRYNFVRIMKGNETRIDEFGFKGGCYNLRVKECEILPVSEKFLVETIVKFKDAKFTINNGQ